MGSEWEIVSLDQVANMRNGAGVKQDFFSNIGVPLARVSDFTADSIDLSGCNFVEPEHAKKWSSHLIAKDDVIVATVGSWPPNWSSVVGKVVRAPISSVGAIQNQNTCCIVPDEKRLNNSFLYYRLKCEDFAWHAANSAGGSANQARLPVKKLSEFRFNLPSLEEQEYIARILGSLDNKISLNRQLNQTLEQMAQALFKSWFVDFDPVIDNALAAGNVIPDDLQDRAERRQLQLAKADHKPLPENIRKLFPSEFELTESLGWVPLGWTEAPLSKIGVLENKSSNPNREPEKTWIHFSIPAFDQDKLPVLDFGSEIKSGKFIVPKTAILLSKLNPETKRIWIPKVEDEKYSVCSTEFMPFVPVRENQRAFLFSLLNEDRTQVDICNRTTGSTGSRQRVKPSEIGSIPVFLPCKELIDCYSSIASAWIEKIQENIESCKQLSKLRDTLLPKLISGELRIPEVQAQLGEALG